MATTQFEQNTINQAGQKHSEESQTMQQQLNKVQGEVQSLLSSSPSESTTALGNVYDQWFANVKNIIVQRTESLTEAMRTTAAEQQDQDEQAKAGTSNIAHFLTGATN